MSDWNDVITALKHDPAIHTWKPLPGTTRTVQATISTPAHGDLTMIIDNGSREDWFQLLIPIAETSEGRIWETTGWCLKDIPAVGLARIGDGIAIRHSIHLPHATTHAITAGINHIVTAATTLYDNTTARASRPPPPAPTG